MPSPPFTDRVVKGAFETSPDAMREQLLAEHQRLATEITNLTMAIAAGGDIPALVKTLADRDKALKIIDAKLAKPVTIPHRDVLLAALELRTAQWRDVLRSRQHLDQARLMLQHVMDLPITVLNQLVPKYIKQGDRPGTENIWKWRAQTKPGGLLVGLVQSVASPR